MRRTALLTLGRLPKALDIATALSMAGWRVIIAEPFGWHLCRVSRHVAGSFKVTAPNTCQKSYLRELLELVHKEEVSLIVPVSKESLHATLVAPELPENVKLFSPSHEVLRELHDKYRFIMLAQSHGLSVPETYLLESAEAKELSTRHDYILKPVYTCSGKGFSSHSRGTPLPRQEDLPLMLVQKKLKGSLKSTFSIVDDGHVIGTVVYKAKILSGTVAVAFERLIAEAQIEQWVRKFAGKISYSGFLSFDMIEDENGEPNAIECNPRATSGIHFLTPECLANAILNPDSRTEWVLRDHEVMQQFFPCLTETQNSFFRRKEFLQNAKTLFTAKDVNFSIRDPFPLWLMPLTSWEIMKRSFLKGQSFGEASTFDIAWFDQPRQASAQQA